MNVRFLKRLLYSLLLTISMATFAGCYYDHHDHDYDHHDHDSDQHDDHDNDQHDGH